MKKLSFPILLVTLVLAASCKDNTPKTDASGVFESDEVIVSAEQTGKLLSFPIKEGDTLRKGAQAGNIDVTNVILQKEQMQPSLRQ